MSQAQQATTNRPSSLPTGRSESATSEWESLLERFVTAPTELIEARALQQRADTKFVLPVSAVPEFLRMLANDYAVLRAGTALIADYRTLYFDTDDLEFYHAHRRGRRVRHKVRLRHYPDRCVSFLEVKTRLDPLRALKSRLQRAYGDNALSGEDLDFVRRRTGLDRALAPQVWTQFSRVSLVGVDTAERVTIDCGLRASMNRPPRSLPNLAIVEVKQSRIAHRTPALLALRACGWRPGWASKYCIAIALTRPDVRPHRRLADLRTVDGVAR